MHAEPIKLDFKSSSIITDLDWLERKSGMTSVSVDCWSKAKQVPAMFSSIWPKDTIFPSLDPIRVPEPGKKLPERLVVSIASVVETIRINMGNVRTIHVVCNDTLMIISDTALKSVSKLTNFKRIL